MSRNVIETVRDEYRTRIYGIKRTDTNELKKKKIPDTRDERDLLIRSLTQDRC